MSECDENEIKAYAMQLIPATVGISVIEQAIKDAAKPEAKLEGFVVWDANDGRADAASFIESIHTALAFCGTDTRDEWVMLGTVPLLYMRSQPRFVQCEPVVCGSLIYIGRHNLISVYTYPNDQPGANGAQFLAGIRLAKGCRVVRGLIQNSPMHVPIPTNLPAEQDCADEWVPEAYEDDFVDEDPPPPKRRCKTKEEEIVDDFF